MAVIELGLRIWTLNLRKFSTILAILLCFFVFFFFSPFTPFTVLQFCRRKEPTTDGSRCVCCCCLCLFICRGEDTSKAKKQLMSAAQRAVAAVNTLTQTHTQRDDGNGDCDGGLQFLNVAAAKLSHNCNALAAEFVVLHTRALLYTHFTLRQVVKGNTKAATTKANRTRRTLNRN